MVIVYVRFIRTHQMLVYKPGLYFQLAITLNLIIGNTFANKKTWKCDSDLVHSEYKFRKLPC